MFSEPKAGGWCTFKFGNFEGEISDWTVEDPIVKLANILISGKSGMVHCDEELAGFDIIISGVTVYVVSDRDEHDGWPARDNKLTVYTSNEMYYWNHDFGLELARDIREIADDWEANMESFGTKAADLITLADKLEVVCKKKRAY